MREEEIKKLKDKVAFILEQIPQTRNSDKLLTIHVWTRFYRHLLEADQFGDRVKYRIPIERIMELPSQDGIKRVRADIQNVQKLFPPTIEKIAVERGWLVDEWKKALGYYVEPTGQTKFSF